MVAKFLGSAKRVRLNRKSPAHFVGYGKEAGVQPADSVLTWKEEQESDTLGGARLENETEEVEEGPPPPLEGQCKHNASDTNPAGLVCKRGC